MFVVEIGSLSKFLNCCDGGQDGGEREWWWRKARRGKAVLLYAEAACPGFLERELAGWSWAGRFRYLFRGGFPTVLNLYSSAVCGITHPSDFEMVSLGGKTRWVLEEEPVQMVNKRQLVCFGRDCSCARWRLDHCGGPPQSCPDPGRWPRLGGRERSAMGGCFTNTGHPPRLFS